jgi:polysaccharide pyruvyl transferase CsaB
MSSRRKNPSGGRKVFDVLLAGYFGFGNLGDELILDAALEILDQCGSPREGVAVLSNDPAGTSCRHRVEAFDRWSLASVGRALSASRSMMLPGGGIFQDATSAKSCAYYWGLVRLAGMKSVPVAALGQSVGPLSGRLARLLTRDALSRCASVAVRDASSAAMLSAMNVRCETMPDVVMSLNAPGAEPGRAALINLRPVRGDGAHARVVARAAEKFSRAGISVIYLAMSEEDADVMSGMRESGLLPGGEITRPRDLGEFSLSARRASAAVGMRLHFGILSHLMGLNTALSPYDPKVSSFAEEWGVKLLKMDDDGETFDIMSLLTNSGFGDKKKFSEIRPLVSEKFKRAMQLLLGDDHERGQTRRT